MYREFKLNFFYENKLKQFYFLPKWNFIENYQHFEINLILSSTQFYYTHNTNANTFIQNEINTLTTLNFFKNDDIFFDDYESLIDSSIITLKNKNEVQLNNYLYLKKPSFISFFINNLIDVPICFKKSHSLKRKNFELPILKFINFLMKKGKKEKIIKLFFLSLRTPTKKKEIEDYNLCLINENWISLYFFINNFFFNQTKINKNFFLFIEDYQKTINSKHLFLSNYKLINTSNFIKNNILNKLTKIFPIFCYFIYSVDKNIKKFSRGKSGKYVFIWKYIPKYKRINVAMKFIAKEIKFNHEKKISNRISKTISKLENEFESTLLYKSKIFSHNYVFKYFKKTLMSHLKTIK